MTFQTTCLHEQHCNATRKIFYIGFITSPRRGFIASPPGLRGIVFTLYVCVSVCPANILVFLFSAIKRDIDLKFIQDTYRVVLNSLKHIDLHW